MKSLIIICVMGLISIFDCKVDDWGVRKVVEFGPEMIDQVRWCEVGLAYWEVNLNHNWVGDGVKLTNTPDGAGGNIGKIGMGFVETHKYRICVNVVVSDGWFEIWGVGTGYDLQVNYGGSFVFDIVSTGGTQFNVDASGMTGYVTYLSCKEVLSEKIVEEE